MVKLATDIGTKVTRKRDGLTGTISERVLCVPSVAHPGIYGKTVLTIHFEDGSHDSTGDLGWFRSNFKGVK
jgi:hypothetical protein